MVVATSGVDKIRIAIGAGFFCKAPRRIQLSCTALVATVIECYRAIKWHVNLIRLTGAVTPDNGIIQDRLGVSAHVYATTVATSRVARYSAVD